jgi:tetratricopeptide (TPR) repeat protein
VAIALAEKKPEVALERVKQQISRAPKSARLQNLLGGIYVARGEAKLAEAAFLRALELEPTLVGAYLSLAQLYAASGKYDEALAKLDEALKADPKNLIVHMRIGMLNERKGDFLKAQQAYERALALDPRFAPAANNLAYLYSERGGDKEKALQLAQIAKEVAPNDPYISDTLGWILYKRGVYQRALSLLRESATRLPENPAVQYHLGMAYTKVGDKDAAARTLTLAVNSPTNFPGKDEAKKVLAELRP